MYAYTTQPCKTVAPSKHFTIEHHRNVLKLTAKRNHFSFRLKMQNVALISSNDDTPSPVVPPAAIIRYIRQRFHIGFIVTSWNLWVGDAAAG